MQEIQFKHKIKLIYCEVKDWNRLLREVVESPSLEIFKTHRNTVLGKLLQLTLL